MSEVLAHIKCMVNTIWSVWRHDLEDQDNVLTRSWDRTQTLLQCCGIKTVLVRSNSVLQVCPLNMLSQVEHGWQIWKHSVCYHKLHRLIIIMLMIVFSVFSSCRCILHLFVKKLISRFLYLIIVDLQDLRPRFLTNILSFV